jgi:hypothetical protein
MSKKETKKKSVTEQNPAATVKLANDKLSGKDLAFNQEHLHSARAKHVASNDQKVVRHPGIDQQHSTNEGALNQE